MFVDVDVFKSYRLVKRHITEKACTYVIVNAAIRINIRL